MQHQLVPLLRQSVYSRLAGYEDTNDAERLAQDPAMRVIVGRRGPERKAASTNTMSRFETEVLTEKENPEGLARMNAQWVDGAMANTPHRRVILDMDSSESPVHGEQEGAAYNGHFGCVCYHPIFVFNQFGDCEGAMLRPGNVHSAHDWREVLEPIMARYERTGVRRYFRADAAFAKPEVYEYLEERRVLYAIRLPSNEVLQWEIAPLLRRPVGRPPRKPIIWYDDFWYQAGSWDRPRRVCEGRRDNVPPGRSSAEVWRLKTVPPVAFNQERQNLIEGGLDVQGGDVPASSQGLLCRRDERSRGCAGIRTAPGHGAQDAQVLGTSRVSTRPTA